MGEGRGGGFYKHWSWGLRSCLSSRQNKFHCLLESWSLMLQELHALMHDSTEVVAAASAYPLEFNRSWADTPRIRGAVVTVHNAPACTRSGT